MGRDITRRNETLPTLATGLPPAQHQAMLALLSGSTVTSAAQYAEVGRATLHRWLADDPAFIAAYN